MDESSTQTVTRLKAVIIRQAREQRQAALEEAKRKATALLAEGEEKLAGQREVILEDAKLRAKTAYSRQGRGAQRKYAGEKLKLQNSLVEGLAQKLGQNLAGLRGQSKYTELLCGMALSAAQMLGGDIFSLQFAKEDAATAQEVVQRLSRLAPELRFSVDEAPALISGGLYVLDAAGKKRACLDFESLAREKADSAAEQLFATA